MSDHSLSPDSSTWPKDPFQLLGVARDVSERDLRKAYLHLVRSYKPEHAPLEFRLIRQAYETAQNYQKFAQTWDEPTEDLFINKVIVSTPTVSPLAPGPDFWEQACQGQIEEAYRGLVDLASRTPSGEETYLQLYWLLVHLPKLDSARGPIDWLIRGLTAIKSDDTKGRLRELLNREFSASPKQAIAERVSALFAPGTPLVLVQDVTRTRWKVARAQKQWELITADIANLRVWVPEVDEVAWVRLLIASAANLAWAEDSAGGRFQNAVREIEQLLIHHHRGLAEELDLVEYIQAVMAGLIQLGFRSDAVSTIYPVLSIAWDDHGPEYRTRVRTYFRQIASDPKGALRMLDRVRTEAPAALGRLCELLGGFGFEQFESSQLALDTTHIIATIKEFLMFTPWSDYLSFRVRLIDFCLRERISPSLTGMVVEQEPGYELAENISLGQTILDDWALRHVYRACELDAVDPSNEIAI